MTVARGLHPDHLLRSAAVQYVSVIVAVAIVGLSHLHGDGLWFQGDAPRHAANGLFWQDLLRMSPLHPVDFALRYYARYPVIAPATYPPLFYLLEALVFGIAGPSPYAAKLLVLGFSAIGGIYTAAWARRWIHPAAGWTGAVLPTLPGVVLWSNAVMLNIPAMALGVGCLFHTRRWLESRQTNQLVAALTLAAATLMTYYLGASVILVGLVWLVLTRPPLRMASALGALGIVLLAAVPLIVALDLSPVHAVRNLPSVASLAQPSTWRFYPQQLPQVMGWIVTLTAVAGIVAGSIRRNTRTDMLFLGSWMVVLIAALSILPAKDNRYLLFAAPAFVLAAATAIALAAAALPPFGTTLTVVGGGAALIGALVAGARVPVPEKSGFRELALYLQQHGPHDAVLYDGAHDGLFGFYMRALDRRFERRLARADRLLFQFGPTTTFAWEQAAAVTTVDQTVEFLRSRAGCRWIAVESLARPSSVLGRRLLREAVMRPEFEWITSFPAGTDGRGRIDLYRLDGDIEAVESLDLQFPSLTTQTFRHVVPITRCNSPACRGAGE